MPRFTHIIRSSAQADNTSVTMVTHILANFMEYGLEAVNILVGVEVMTKTTGIVISDLFFEE